MSCTLHTLTALTGRDAGAHRTVLIQGFEARRRHVVVAACAAAPSALLAAVFWPLLGQYAVLIVPVLVTAALVLVEGRSSRGLRRRTYEALLDRHRSDAGRFYLGGREVDPDLFELGRIVSASVPNPELTQERT